MEFKVLLKTQEVLQAHYKVYGTCVTGQNYPKIPKERKSLDMSPCDYFLSSFIEDKCYTQHPKTVVPLKGVIKPAIQLTSI